MCISLDDPNDHEATFEKHRAFMEDIRETSSFRQEIQSVINRHSKENGSNTPDFVLAQFLEKMLVAFDDAANARDKFYGCGHKIGGGI